MKNLNKALIALVTGAMLTTTANAALNSSNVATGKAYVGIKAGQFDVSAAGDVADELHIDKPAAYGVYGGYTFDNNFGVEAEYMTSSKADVSTKDNDIEDKFKIKVDTIGLYGTYRYNFPNANGLYAKGKLGFAQVAIDDSDNEDIKDSGIAGGLGLGINLKSNFAVEAEYSKLPNITDDGADVDTNLWTIGAHMKF